MILVCLFVPVDAFKEGGWLIVGHVLPNVTTKFNSHSGAWDRYHKATKSSTSHLLAPSRSKIPLSMTVSTYLNMELDKYLYRGDFSLGQKGCNPEVL